MSKHCRLYRHRKKKHKKMKLDDFCFTKPLTFRYTRYYTALSTNLQRKRGFEIGFPLSFVAIRRLKEIRLLIQKSHYSI